MFKKLTLIMCIVLFALPTIAQDNPPTHPLEDILRHIPATDSTRNSPLTYTNIQATHQSLDWLDADETYTYDSFIEAYPNGLQFISRWAAQPEELMNIPFGVNPAGEIATLDIFNIGQIAHFGQTLDSGTILRGNFDTDELLAVYGGYRAYQVESNAPYHFIRNRSTIEAQQLPHSFFDTMMRRAFPLVIQTGDDVSFIGNARSEAFYDTLITSFEHSDSSIWHEPYYQLTAQALMDWETANNATLIQAVWLTQNNLKRTVDFRASGVLNELPLGLQPSDSENLIPRWAQSYREITDYQLPVVVADLQLDDEMVFLLIVPFDHVGNAQFSSIALVERLRTFGNQVQTQGQTPLIILHNGTISHTLKQDTEDRAVAVIAIRYDAFPTASDDDQIYQAGLYKTIYQSITSGTFYPLWDVITP